MSYLREVPPDEKTAAAFEDIRAAFGFVPNFFRGQTIRPDFIEAEVQLVDTLLVREGALTRQQKEYVFLVCSAANLNTYCVTAHCEIVRMLGLAGPDPEQIAVDYTVVKLPMQMKALLAFALKLNGDGSKVAARDVDALRTYGYSDAQILETVAIVGLAKFTNTVSFGLGTVPDFSPAKAALPAAAG